VHIIVHSSDNFPRILQTITIAQMMSTATHRLAQGHCMKVYQPQPAIF